DVSARREALEQGARRRPRSNGPADEDDVRVGRRIRLSPVEAGQRRNETGDVVDPLRGREPLTDDMTGVNIAGSRAASFPAEPAGAQHPLASFGRRRRRDSRTRVLTASAQGKRRAARKPPGRGGAWSDTSH